MLYNHRLLSIAVRDAELRAPVQIGQTYDINSQDRPVIDTTNKAAVLPVLPLPLPLPTARPELCWWSTSTRQERQTTPARSINAGDAVYACCVCAICCVMLTGSPVSLTTQWKSSKDNRNKKLNNTSFTNRKSESDVKMQKHLAKKRTVGRHFWL